MGAKKPPELEEDLKELYVHDKKRKYGICLLKKKTGYKAALRALLCFKPHRQEIYPSKMDTPTANAVLLDNGLGPDVETHWYLRPCVYLDSRRESPNAANTMISVKRA